VGPVDRRAQRHRRPAGDGSADGARQHSGRDGRGPREPPPRRRSAAHSDRPRDPRPRQRPRVRNARAEARARGRRPARLRPHLRLAGPRLRRARLRQRL
jgi:hypothetical protein